MTNDDGGTAPELEEFLALRGQALLRLGWLLTGDLPAAEDLVQDALARVLPHWDALAVDHQERYVRTAIRTAWIDTLRRRSARVRLNVVPELPEPPAQIDESRQTDLRVSLQAALKTLTVRQRTVLVLRFYEDLTETETARALGCSVSTVKSTSRQALERLRERAPGLESLLREGVAS